MNKYRVDIYDSYWKGNLINRLYIEAESESDARNKAYIIWEKSLIVQPLNKPCFNIMSVV